MALKISDIKFEEELTRYFKSDMRNLTIFDPSTWKSHITDIFFIIIYNVWAKQAYKHRRVMFDGTEEWCKIWRGIDLSFQNWHEEFDKFWPEHSNI